MSDHDDDQGTSEEHPGLAMQARPLTAHPGDPLQTQSRLERVDAAITAWHDALRSSPISRSTEAWNHLVASLPALRAALREI